MIFCKQVSIYWTLDNVYLCIFMNIAHKIINLDKRAYHMHTSSFSDGIQTWDELVQYAKNFLIEHWYISWEDANEL